MCNAKLVEKIDRYTRICLTLFHRIICLRNQLIILKGLFQKYHFAKFCIVFNFSWDLQSPQEKLKTIIMHNFGGTTNSIGMIFCRSSSLRLKSSKGVVMYTAISHDRVVIDYINHNYGVKKQLLNPVIMIFKVNEVSRVLQISG